MARPKKAQTEKKPRKPREKKEKAAKVPGAALGHNLGIDPDKRELFLSDLRKWQALDKAAKSAGAKRRAFEKEIKSDGFLLDQIHLADKLATPEGEEEFRLHTANLLIAAQYVGAAIGTQLNLFLEPSREPAEDVAYDEGTRDSMEGKTANPKYDPSLPQHARYMAGYHDETERRMQKGMKKLDPEKEQADRAASMAAARPSGTVPPVPDTTH